MEKVKNPSQRRQLWISLSVLLGFGLVFALSYFFFMPREQVYRLQDYDTATVVRQEIRDILRVNGSVALSSRQDLLAPESGLLTELLIAQGDQVSEGQLLARMRSRELEEANINAQRRLRDLRQDSELAEIRHERNLEDQQLQLMRARTDVDRAQDELAELRELHAAGAASGRELQNAEAALRSAEDSLHQAQRSIDHSKLEYELGLRAVQNSAERIQEEVSDIEQRLAGLNLFSPLDGQVLDVRARSGAFISQWTEIAHIADTSRPHLEVQIPERSLPGLEQGMPAEIIVAGSRYPAVLSWISMTSSSSASGAGAVLDAHLDFTGDPPRLVPGTSASAEIIKGTVPDALTLPRGPYLTTGGERTVFLVDGDRAERKAVIFGTVSGDRIQVRSGLQEGDVIISSGYQNFINEESIELSGEKK